MGPLLFLIYINDIVHDIGSNIRLFADDTSLFIIVDNPLIAATNLNTDLEKISRWAATWLVSSEWLVTDVCHQPIFEKIATASRLSLAKTRKFCW